MINAYPFIAEWKYFQFIGRMVIWLVLNKFWSFLVQLISVLNSFESEKCHQMRDTKSFVHTTENLSIFLLIKTKISLKKKVYFLSSCRK